MRRLCLFAGFFFASASAWAISPTNVEQVGGANYSVGQVSVLTSATQIVAARTGDTGTGRICVTVTNTTTTAIYLGGSGVTTSTGDLLAGVVGASKTICTQAAVYGIAGSSATVTYFETY